MKLFFIFAALFLSTASSFAQEAFIDPANSLPSCSVDSYTKTCALGGSGNGSNEIPGCSISCPETRIPECVAGRSGLYCTEAIVAPVCKCL